MAAFQLILVIFGGVGTTSMGGSIGLGGSVGSVGVTGSTGAGGCCGNIDGQPASKNTAATTNSIFFI
ncbi:hypothetical protein CSC16_1745 [Proteus mirabilis]|nr:hypothetical protein BB2000_0989 [Proteus mirabilis BB2000]AWF42327.1 hypothetical protein CSC16_1745 [Proteus mirabilis]